LDETDAACRAALGNLIFGQDDQTLQEVVVPLLRQQEKTVCTAESCTGGLLAKYLTDVPGSSAVFKQGWVTYSDEAKVSELDVRPEVIKQYGAVSRETVHAMALNALNKAAAACAVSISGIAGPDGGTPTKPVGTVCFGFAYDDGRSTSVTTRTIVISGDRETVRDRSAKMALTMLRYHLLGKELPF
jgi:nicotinamide-nucleotide amidase